MQKSDITSDSVISWSFITRFYCTPIYFKVSSSPFCIYIVLFCTARRNPNRYKMNKTYSETILGEIEEVRIVSYPEWSHTKRAEEKIFNFNYKNRKRIEYKIMRPF